MKVSRFELERWQSIWENQVELNISESGVEPLTVEELVEDQDELRRLQTLPLGYPQTNGSEELRIRIAALYPGAQAENILVTSGCAEANFLGAWSLVEPGDEVIFMQPNYLQLGLLVESLGATVKPLWLHEEMRWGPSLDELRSLVTPKTKLIAVCSPNNPTGAVLTENGIKEICSIAEKVGAYVLADEVYRGAEFESHLSPTFWGNYDRLSCNGGLAKAYGLPGLRIGWIVTSPERAEELWAYKDFTTIAPTLLSDRLATIALEPARHEKLRERTRGILKKNYAVVSEWIASHNDRFTHIPPLAGAIAWVGSKDKSWDAGKFAEELRKKKSVLMVPGAQFGPEMKSWFRLGYGSHAEQLQQALSRMDELLAG
jgi:hypothetical protein